MKFKTELGESNLFRQFDMGLHCYHVNLLANAEGHIEYMMVI